MTAKQRHRARKWERGDIHPTYTPLPIDTCERLESYAEMMGISRADAIRQACAEFLARHHDEICRYEVGTIRSRYDRDTRAIQEAEACRDCLDKVTGKDEDKAKKAAVDDFVPKEWGRQFARNYKSYLAAKAQDDEEEERDEDKTPEWIKGFNAAQKRGTEILNQSLAAYRAMHDAPEPENQAQVITFRMDDASDGLTRGEEAETATSAHEAPENASQGTPEGKESF